MTQYGRLCSEFYDLDKPEARPDALECYLDYAKFCRGPILEPMCGTGRYLLPLLAQGFDIEGVDSSSEMLKRCRSRGQALGLCPTLHEDDLERLNLPRSFGFVFIPSGSFCLITQEDKVRTCLARIYSALMPGGLFVVEVERAGMIEPSLSGPWEGRWLERGDGSKIIQSFLRQYSGVEGIARHIHRYEFVRDGQLITTEFEDLAVKHYEIEAFQSLLKDARFKDIRCYKPFERTAPDAEDEGLLFECRKS